MSRAVRAYHLLLRAYPRAFRDVYAREMTLAFRDHHREWQGGRAQFWAGMLSDVVRSAPAEWRDAWNHPTGESKMKTIAILAVVFGVLEALNAGVEASAGGPSVTVVLVVLAGVLLVIAGVAMLRAASAATMLGHGAAIACLAVVAFARLFQPWMSGLSMAVGIAFPIVLLVSLHWRQGRPSTA